MLVEMKAKQKVELNKIVDMRKSDYDEYNAIINNRDMSLFEQEVQINEIAERYGMNEGDNIIDWDDMEETEFNLFKE